MITLIVALSSCDFIKSLTQTIPSTPQPSTSYIVSVELEPSGLESVDLAVVKSPEGSKLTAGSVISKTPGQIVLDKVGTWQFQGQLNDVKSEIITLQLPEQRSFTITMP